MLIIALVDVWVNDCVTDIRLHVWHLCVPQGPAWPMGVFLRFHFNLPRTSISLSDLGLLWAMTGFSGNISLSWVEDCIVGQCMFTIILSVLQCAPKTCELDAIRTPLFFECLDAILSTLTIVVNHSQHSTPASFRYGVPQGSVLEPILFILFTQPLSNVNTTLYSFSSNVCRWHTDLQIVQTIWNCRHNQ